jgi:hypothetical protein
MFSVVRSDLSVVSVGSQQDFAFRISVFESRTSNFIFRISIFEFYHLVCSNAGIFLQGHQRQR